MITENQSPPAISVIVCNDDNAVDLEPCIRAALDQEYGGAFDVTVIDDGTGNVSLSLVEGMPVTVVRKDRPRGWLDSVAIAAGNARYGILAFTDSDCIVPKDWLRVIGALLADRDLITGNIHHGSAFRERFSHLFTHFHFASRKPGPADFLSDGNFAVRKDLLHRCLPELPLDLVMGNGAGAVVLSRVVRDMGVPVLLDPALVVHHKSEGFRESLRLWFSDYGPNTLDIRRALPGVRGGRFLRLGFLAPFLFAPGRWLTDMRHFLRSWRRFGMRPHELPLCAVWYGACGASYLLGMLNHLKKLNGARWGAAESGTMPRQGGCTTA